MTPAKQYALISVITYPCYQKHNVLMNKTSLLKKKKLKKK